MPYRIFRLSVLSLFSIACAWPQSSASFNFVPLQSIYSGSTTGDINEAGDVGARCGVWVGGGAFVELRYTSALDCTLAAINEVGGATGTLQALPPVRNVAIPTAFSYDNFRSYDGIATPLKMPEPRVPSYGVDINNHGDITGYWVEGRLRVVYHGFVLRDGVMADLGSFGGGETRPTAMNDAGDVVGISDGHGFLYRNGQLMNLGDYGPTAINQNGHIVGTYYDSNGQYRVFFYDGSMHDVGPSIDGAIPHINDVDDVLAGTMVYAGGTVIDLSTTTSNLPSGWYSLRTTGINNKRQISVTAYTNPYVPQTHPGIIQPVN